jgi:hypothetical protein
MNQTQKKGKPTPKPPLQGGGSGNQALARNELRAGEGPKKAAARANNRARNKAARATRRRNRR